MVPSMSSATAVNRRRFHGQRYHIVAAAIPAAAASTKPLGTPGVVIALWTIETGTAAEAVVLLRHCATLRLRHCKTTISLFGTVPCGPAYGAHITQDSGWHWSWPWRVARVPTQAFQPVRMARHCWQVPARCSTSQTG